MGRPSAGAWLVRAPPPPPLPSPDFAPIFGAGDGFGTSTPQLSESREEGGVPTRGLGWLQGSLGNVFCGRAGEVAAVGASHPGRERQPSQWDAGTNSPPPGDGGHACPHRLEAVKRLHREAPDSGLMPGTEKEEK